MKCKSMFLRSTAKLLDPVGVTYADACVFRISWAAKPIAMNRNSVKINMYGFLFWRTISLLTRRLDKENKEGNSTTIPIPYYQQWGIYGFLQHYHQNRIPGTQEDDASHIVIMLYFLHSNSYSSGTIHISSNIALKQIEIGLKWPRSINQFDAKWLFLCVSRVSPPHSLHQIFEMPYVCVIFLVDEQ